MSNKLRLYIKLIGLILFGVSLVLVVYIIRGQWGYENSAYDGPYNIDSPSTLIFPKIFSNKWRGLLRRSLTIFPGWWFFNFAVFIISIVLININQVLKLTVKISNK